MSEETTITTPLTRQSWILDSFAALAEKERSDIGAGGAEGVLFSEAIEAEGALVFAKACEMGLEGIVSKRAGSVYKSGRCRNWLKTRNPAFIRKASA
jgi:ATP-dependent DNA ligase